MISKINHGVYIGKTDADKKNSEKVTSNFEKCVNLYSRMVLSFKGKYHHAICAVQLRLVHRESYLSTKQSGQNSISISLEQ